MRTVTYKEVLRRVAVPMGWDPDDIAGADQAAANVMIQRRVEFAWEAFPWPELCVSQKRTFREPWAAGARVAGDERYHRASKKYYIALKGTSAEPATLVGGSYVVSSDWAVMKSSYVGLEVYSSTTTYLVGRQVYFPDTDRFYQLHVASSVGFAPSNTAKWGLLNEFERFIDYEQSWEATAIGQALKAWNGNPRLDSAAITTSGSAVFAGTATELSFDLQDNGVRVYGSEPVVYVKFLKRCPIYSGTGAAPWLKGSGTYATGERVYDPTTGDFYESLEDGNLNPVTDSATWERVLFPRILANYVAQGAHADLKGKADGQPDVYPNEAEESYQILLNEYDKIERLQGQSEQLNVVT